MKHGPPAVRWRMRGLLPVLIFASGLVCSFGTAFADGPWLPHNVSTLGEQSDRLWTIIFWLTTVMFFATEICLIYFVVRYRRKPGVKAAYVHESNRVEVIWSVIPGLILLFLALYQWNAWANMKLRAPTGPDVLRVQVLAQQFEWNVRYPGPDGRFATADDITLKNQLYVPEGRPVVVQLRAVDVIHSFFLPNMRVKQDAVPGLTSLVWFDANQTGNYEIACSELCGLGHYRMRGQLYVQTEDEFAAWLQEKADAGFAPGDWGWDWEEGI